MGLETESKPGTRGDVTIVGESPNHSETAILVTTTILITAR